MESKAADASPPPRLGRWIAIGVVVVCCSLALGLGLGCGLTGENCLSDEPRAPPAPLGIPPGGFAFISASVSLGGYTVATFDPPAATAFVAGVTTTLGLRLPHRRLILGGIGTRAAPFMVEETRRKLGRRGQEWQNGFVGPSREFTDVPIKGPTSREGPPVRDLL